MNANNNYFSTSTEDALPMNRIFINTKNLLFNVNRIRSLTSPDTAIIAMIKSNAYGHGIISIAKKLELADIQHFGVFTLEEGIQLRENGIHSSILIFGPLLNHQFSGVNQYHLIPVIGSHIELSSFLQQECSRSIPIHLKVDTGMGRIGFYPKELPSIIEKLNNNSVSIQGICTHYADSGNIHTSYTEKQTQLFEDMLQSLPGDKLSKYLIHTSNSAAVIRFPSYHFNAIRPGLVLYGISPIEQDQKNWKPVLSLESYISVIKEVPPNSYISYNRTFQTTRHTVLGIIPRGYADGIPLSLSNVGKVIVNGSMYPIIGNVCMNQFMIDLTDCSSPTIGDKVILIGQSGDSLITVSDVAQWGNTIPYEILCNLTDRIPRIVL